MNVCDLHGTERIEPSLFLQDATTPKEHAISCWCYQQKQQQQKKMMMMMECDQPRELDSHS
jgi:hypothetical protein